MPKRKALEQGKLSCRKKQKVSNGSSDTTNNAVKKVKKSKAKKKKSKRLKKKSESVSCRMKKKVKSNLMSKRRGLVSQRERDLSEESSSDDQATRSDVGSMSDVDQSEEVDLEDFRLINSLQELSVNDDGDDALKVHVAKLQVRFNWRKGRKEVLGYFGRGKNTIMVIFDKNMTRFWDMLKSKKNYHFLLKFRESQLESYIATSEGRFYNDTTSNCFIRNPTMEAEEREDDVELKPHLHFPKVKLGDFEKLANGDRVTIAGIRVEHRRDAGPSKQGHCSKIDDGTGITWVGYSPREEVIDDVDGCADFIFAAEVTTRNGYKNSRNGIKLSADVVRKYFSEDFRNLQIMKEKGQGYTSSDRKINHDDYAKFSEAQFLALRRAVKCGETVVKGKKKLIQVVFEVERVQNPTHAVQERDEEKPYFQVAVAMEIKLQHEFVSLWFSDACCERSMKLTAEEFQKWSKEERQKFWKQFKGQKVHVYLSVRGGTGTKFQVRVDKFVPFKGIQKPTRLRVFCICGGPETRDMVECEMCRNWFHFGCVNLTQKKAEEMTFFCDSCQQRNVDDDLWMEDNFHDRKRKKGRGN